MKIRVYDKFNQEETIAIYEDVEAVVGKDIYFEDGDIYEDVIDEDSDWEEVIER